MVDDAANDDDELNPDHRCLGDQINDISAAPTEEEEVRSMRQRRRSTRYNTHDYVLFTNGGEPQTFQEAMAHDHREKWVEAMIDEMKSL